jgi:hypothetical protein
VVDGALLDAHLGKKKIHVLFRMLERFNSLRVLMIDAASAGCVLTGAEVLLFSVGLKIDPGYGGAEDCVYELRQLHPRPLLIITSNAQIKI